MLTGRAHVFGHDISADLHVFDKHSIFSRASGGDPMKEMAQTMLARFDSDFASRRRPGDFIVAGRNFGTLSMYDQSASIILAGGIRAVIAESFDVLFSRHAVNRGLLLVSCSTAGIETGDELQVDVQGGLVRCVAKGLEQPCRVPKPKVLEWLADGGAIEYLRLHGHL